EDASAEGVNEYVGTGPFEVVDWDPQHSLKLKKHEDYSPVDEETSGLAGYKEAKVDEVTIEIVTDGSSRVSGMQTGQYDIATRIPYDNVEEIESDESLKTFELEYGFIGAFFNNKEGIFQDKKARQAVNTALNMDDLLYA